MKYRYLFFRTFLFFFTISIFVINPSYAQNNNAELFIIENIAISSENVPNLRETAIASGQTQALTALIERLLTHDDQEKFKQLMNHDVPNFVQDFQLQDEEISLSAYKATMIVRFSPEKVKSFLDQNNFFYSLAPLRTFLILPIILKENIAHLWFEQNLWFDAWQDAQTKSQRVEFLLPLKDLEDIDSISVEQALSGDLSALRKIAQKYQVHDVIVCIAEIQEHNIYITMNPYGQLQKDTIAYLQYNLGDNSQKSQSLLDYNPQQNFENEMQSIFKDAIEKLTLNVEESWKKYKKESSITPQATEIEISASIKNLSQWYYVRASLEKSPQLDSFSVVSLGRSEAKLTLKTYESIESLAAYLEGDNLYLVHNEGISWNLYFEKPAAKQSENTADILPSDDIVISPETPLNAIIKGPEEH